MSRELSPSLGGGVKYICHVVDAYELLAREGYSHACTCHGLSLSHDSIYAHSYEGIHIFIHTSRILIITKLVISNGLHVRSTTMLNGTTAVILNTIVCLYNDFQRL